MIRLSGIGPNSAAECNRAAKSPVHRADSQLKVPNWSLFGYHRRRFLEPSGEFQFNSEEYKGEQA